MAPEEARKLRRAGWSDQVVTVHNTPTPLVDFDPTRFSLVISCTSAAVWLRHSGDPANGSGILLAANGFPLLLSLDQNGPMVFGPWKAIAPGGDVNVCFAEASSSEL